VSICKEILNIKYIGIHDNLMELGGTSILMLRLAEAIGREFNTDIKLSDFKQCDTVSKLAGLFRITSMKRSFFRM
jgi:acyl carrier protein